MVRKKHHSSCPIIQKKIEKKIARCWCGSTMFYPFFGGLVFHSVLEFADVSWFLHLFFWSLLFFMAFGSLFLILLNSSRLKLCLSEVWWAHSFPQQRGHVFRTPVRRSGLLAASLYRSTEVTEVGDFLKRHFWLCLSERCKVPRFRPFLWPRVEKRYVGFVTLKGQAQIVADARCEFERPFQRQHEVACWSGPLWLNLISDGVGKLRSDKTVNSTLTPPPRSQSWRIGVRQSYCSFPRRHETFHLLPASQVQHTSHRQNFCTVTKFIWAHVGNNIQLSNMAVYDPTLSTSFNTHLVNPWERASLDSWRGWQYFSFFLNPVSLSRMTHPHLARRPAACSRYHTPAGAHFLRCGLEAMSMRMYKRRIACQGQFTIYIQPTWAFPFQTFVGGSQIRHAWTLAPSRNVSEFAKTRDITSHAGLE